MRPDSPPEPAPLNRVEVHIFRSARWALISMLALNILFALLKQLGVFLIPQAHYAFTVGLDPMIRAGYYAMIVCYLALGFVDLEMLVVVVLAVIFEFIVFTMRPVSWDISMRLSTMGVGAGLAAVLGMIFRVAFTQGVRRQRALGYLCVASFLPLFPSIVPVFLYWITRLHPTTLDPIGYAVDGAIGFQPTFVIAHFLLAHQAFFRFCLNVYVMLPLFMILCILVRLRWPARGYNDPVIVLSGAGVLALIFYNFLPMVGVDIYLGPEVFPLGSPPTVTDFAPFAAPSGPRFPRSCIPSLHLSWILAVFFAIRRVSRPFLVLGLGIVFFTFLGAMSPPVGHYWIDMLAAFPFVTFLQALSVIPGTTGERERKQALIGSAVLFLGCEATIRWAYPVLLLSAPLTLALQAFVIGASLVLENRLGRAPSAAEAEAQTAPPEPPGT